MQNLTRAHNELFRRTDDEAFSSLPELLRHCQAEKAKSLDRWHAPLSILPEAEASGLRLTLGNDGAFLMNDWSFGQLCHFAGVSKETVNRLSPATARQVFAETMPKGNKPLQVFTDDRYVRSIHGVSYTRLHNADLVAMLSEFAVDFQPPQKAADSIAGEHGGTGLYCGEQDLFAFLIDPTGWTEIDGEAFAPGFFVWNSEVGKRSIGIETFWFQAVCQNHIVWDAVEVVEFTRKHTANVHECLGEIRRIVEALVAKRDERKDGFARVIRKAMQTRLGNDSEEALEALGKHGVTKTLAKRALELARENGRFTIFSLVDALTRIAGEEKNAGDRVGADIKAAKLLALAI
jgi:histone H3/H4